MGARRIHTNALPDWPPGPGREYYLPEYYYYYDTPGFPLSLATRVTASSVAQWADRYEAFTVGSRMYHQQGLLPSYSEEREELINKAVDELESHVELYVCAINLYKGDQPLLQQGDGIPGNLTLIPYEFEQLQHDWQSHGLPGDLYYPGKDQVTVVEPIEMHDTVVFAEQRYTPVGWAHRDQAMIEATPIPTEAARIERFVEACMRFVRNVELRKAELREPGRTSTHDEIVRLGQLQSLAVKAARRTQGQDQLGERDQDPAGDRL